MAQSSKTLYVGLDVHKESLAVAYASLPRDGVDGFAGHGPCSCATPMAERANPQKAIQPSPRRAIISRERMLGCKVPVRRTRPASTAPGGDHS